MKNNKHALATGIAPQMRPALYWTMADAFILAKRQLLQIPRIPDELATSTIQPILLVLFFRYVFGGAIAVSGTSYVNYLIAGVLVESVMIGSASTGVGVATDLQRGLIDRFRSLPMAQSAVLTGRAIADLVRNTLIILVAWITGLLVGFRPAGPILFWVAALGLLLLTSLVFSWFSSILGLLLRSAEAVQQAGLIWIFPMMFASSAFVPTSTMPDWLRAFAEHQPVSLIINAERGLLLNQPDAANIWLALAWCAGLLVIFIPLAGWAYGRRIVR